MDQNLSLLSSRLAADVARDSVEISRSGHLPTVAHHRLSAACRTRTSIENLAFGGPPASIRYPAVGNQQPDPAAGHRADLQRRTDPVPGPPGAVPVDCGQGQRAAGLAPDRAPRARFLSTAWSARSQQVNALRQGLESAQVALQATQAGYDVGTRTDGGSAAGAPEPGAGADQLLRSRATTT